MSRYRRILIFGICALLVACAAVTSSIVRKGQSYLIEMPLSSLVIEFPAEGYTVEIADTSTPYYFLKNEKTKLNVSFNFERATSCKSSESCRDFFANKLKAGYPSKKNWRMSQIGEVFVSENMDGPISGFDLKHQHMNAHFVKEGIWVDVPMSKVDYKEKDQELFVNFVRSIGFKPKR